MTKIERERLRKLIANPPHGSKLEAAKRHGVDLSLLLRNLELTPDQRVREMEGALRLVAELRRAHKAKPR